MKKIVIWSLLALIVIVLGGVAINYISNPLRKSEEQIREYMLDITPIGTSMEDVIKVIEDNEYEQLGKYKHFDRGYLIWHGNLEMYYDGFPYSESDVIGKETIEAAIGQYTNFFNVTVFSYWAFDEDAKLIDIAIKKDADTL